MSTYKEVLSYLFSLERFGMVFGLENILSILESIGNPHERIKTIHVGGTNGKGSVTTFISESLKNFGYRVGTYTSPHLISFTERIRINGERIKEEEVAEISEYIRKEVEKRGNRKPFTFFDFTTALAFEYFYRNNVDMAVIEVGLGGRLDSTNVIRPLLSVITNVDYDHMDYLGTTLKEIAREKAGIIKEGVPVVTGSSGEALEVLSSVAQEQKSSLFVLNRDFWFKKIKERTMDYYGVNWMLGGIEIGLAGDHQLFNASIALCSIEILSKYWISADEKSLRDAMKNAKWEGRLEVLKETPLVVADGAHNIAGIKALSTYLKDHYHEKKKILIFGVLKDKEYEKMLKEISRYVDYVILTKPKADRAVEPELLKGFTDKYFAIEKDLERALERAFSIAGKKDLILITGSLYTVGEAKLLIDEKF